MHHSLAHLLLLDECVNIQGGYYTVSNGFVIKMHGTVQLQYKDMLAVEFVMYHSKKILYAMLLSMGIITFVLNLKNFLSIITAVLLVIIVCVMGILYLLSLRQFVEITTMYGTYRVAIKQRDFEIENIVAQLQRRIIKKT